MRAARVLPYYNENAVVSCETVREHLLCNLLRPDASHQLIVASVNDRVLGQAAIALVYSLVEPSVDQRRHCQLKELYVRADARSRGVGRGLMQWLARYALASGCCRIDWPVQAANARGIAFYDGLGAVRVAERLSYRLTGTSLHLLGAAD